MKIEFRKGKKTLKCFMPFVIVTRPCDWPEEETAYYNAIRTGRKDNRWRFYAKFFGQIMSLLRRENSAKAIFRWIKKQHFEPGTTVICTNWYVGYADMVVTVTESDTSRKNRGT